MRFLPLDRVRLGAGCTTLLAALVASALAPTGATAHHNSSWWATDSEDQASWSGAGAGWNGGSTTTTSTTTTSTATWTPQDTREVDVRDLRVDRAAISPNGDGEGDEVFVSLRLRRDSAPVRVHVVDATGTTVRTLGEQRSTRVYGRFGWDGTTDSDAVVPDGAYRIVLVKADTTTSREDAADPLSIDVLVDTVSPAIQARRPTLVQLRALARRAGDLRDARRRWAARWNRHPLGGPPGQQRHRQQRWSAREQQWVRLFESRQLRLPVTFTTVEDGNVTITTAVAGRTAELETWRAAGRHTLDVVLPTYAAGRQVSITFETSDDAGNTHRHTIVALLPAMPAPKPVRDRHEHDRPKPSTPAPVTGVPTSGGGPLPDWLDPIMLRATYAAGVPQSWAKSQALSNIIYRESSYRPTAQNPTSTAYGLFQFLDQTWATVGCRKTSDAYRQSVCGLRYIQRRYRTPEAAWRFWQANHWY